MYVENPRITFRRNFVKILDAWVEHYGASSAELGRVTGINKNTISKYRQGTTYPSPEHLAKLAAALQQPVEVFFRREAPKCNFGTLKTVKTVKEEKSDAR